MIELRIFVVIYVFASLNCLIGLKCGGLTELEDSLNLQTFEESNLSHDI